ncbi:pyruvate synthase subunit PorA [Thermodesulfobacteriota bacterium]
MSDEGLHGWKVLTGNQACAYGVCMCKPNVIAAYPITPQTTILEELASFGNKGILQAEFITVEGENSAMGSCLGASAAGGRTFTATSSNGLAFMYDGYVFAAGNRVPIVMAIVMRDQVAPHCVAAGQQDAIMVKDQGWIQIYASSCQEILDLIIMAYRLAEDTDILIPVNICYEGFYLSYMSQNVYVPTFEEVDQFLAPLKEMKRTTWNLEEPMGFSSYVTGNLFMEYRYKHASAFERAKDKFEQISHDFSKQFERDYGGQIEEYRTDDADVVLVMMGASCGTAKPVIDAMREQGKKVGLIRIRMFRPFPKERLTEAIRNKKAIGVLDRNVNCGWNSGHVYMELRATQSISGINIPTVGFIDGLSGADIPESHIERAIDITMGLAKGKETKELTWLALE